MEKNITISNENAIDITPSPILSVSHLTKTYGDLKAVDDISFTAERGSLFSFLGVNGAGKSTTINIICSILTKDSGVVTVDGYDLDKQSNLIKPILGIVFQNTVLDTLLTVKENLTVRASYYSLYGDKWKVRLDELTELLDLSQILKRPFGKLSGGQKRRVDIARGLIHNPKLLILDEPTTGLDPQTRKTVWEIIDRLRREKGMTVFLTTHYMEEADGSDRVVVIDKGKIVADDTPVNLKNRYSGNYLLLYGETRQLESKLTELDKKFEQFSGGCRVPVSGSFEAKKFIAENDALCSDFEFVKGNMDDVFLAVTGRRLGGIQ